MTKFFNDSPLSEIQKEFLIGTLLGDASLVCNGRKDNWYFFVEHGSDQKEYLFYKYSILKEFVKSPPRQLNKKLKDKYFIHYAFSTPIIPAFKEYGELFYQWQEETGRYKKHVPKNIKDLLTERGLAFWYMDDGSRKSKDHKGIYLNTQGFSPEDNLLLQKVLQEKFTLEVSIKTSRDKRYPGRQYQQLFISGNSLEQLRSLIEPYLLANLKALPEPRKKPGRKAKY